MERFVKYFDPRYEDDVHLGRFMAGTTVSYCAKEKYSDLIQGLLSDEAEGSIILNYDIEPAYVEKFVSPLFTFINSVTPGIKMKIKAQANDHLFCGARGKYNREHHLKIVNGIRVNDRIIYPSNPNYTMFCEINFSRFLCSLKEAAGGVVRPQNDFTPQVIWANVRYTKHPKEIRFSGVLPKRYDYSEHREDHYRNSAFTKPKRFAVENEVRFVISFHQPGETPHDALPWFFQSELIKKSVVRIGRL